MTITTNRETRRAHINRELEAGGVQVIELPGGIVKLYGQFGNVILTNDVLNLRPHEINRLCGSAL